MQKKYAKKFFLSNGPISNKKQPTEEEFFFHLTYSSSHQNIEIKTARIFLVVDPLDLKTSEMFDQLRRCSLAFEQIHYMLSSSKRFEQPVVLKKIQEQKGAKGVTFLGFGMSGPLIF